MTRTLSRTLTALCLALGLSASLLQAQDWPRFLGPDGTGASTETGLAKSWPEGGPKVLWTVPLGAGFAGPAVLDNEVFILDRPNDKEDVLRCLSLADGKELWSFAYPAEGKFSFNGSRTTPTVTADAVYVIGPLGDFHCIDRNTHAVKWAKNLLTDFGGSRPNWAVSQSPLLYGNTIIAAPCSPNVGVAAFNIANGDIVWKTDSLGGLNYSSPILTTIAGVEQVLMMTGKGAVSGIDVTSGKVLWTYSGWECNIPITSPAPIGDGRVFISGEYGAGSAMIKVTAADGTFSVEELYKTQVCGSQIHPPLLQDGYLYMNSNGNKRRDGFICIDLDGTVKWKTSDAPNFERGPVLLADGMIYSVNGNDGTLALFEANPTEFKMLASAPVLQGKQVWAPMALARGHLLVRDQAQMKCLFVGVVE